MPAYTLRNTYVVLYPGVGQSGYSDWSSANLAAQANLEQLDDEISLGNTLTPDPGDPNALLLKIGTGKISWSEAQSFEYDLERGKLDPKALGTATEGDAEPMTVSFDAIVEYYMAQDSSRNPRTVMEVENEEGACYPMPVDIAAFVNECADAVHGQFYIADFRWESLAYDPANGQLSVTGKSMFPTAFVREN